jgi:hypothetical protein
VKTETKGKLTRAFVGHDNGRGSACLAAIPVRLRGTIIQKKDSARARSARARPRLVHRLARPAVDNLTSRQARRRGLKNLR